MFSRIVCRSEHQIKDIRVKIRGHRNLVVGVNGAPVDTASSVVVMVWGDIGCLDSA